MTVRASILGRDLAVTLLRCPDGELYTFAAPCPGPEMWAVVLETGATVRVRAQELRHDRHRVLAVGVTLASLRARGAGRVRP